MTARIKGETENLRWGMESGQRGILIVIAALLGGPGLGAQTPGLVLSLAPASPATFNNGPTGVGAHLNGIVRTEPLTLVLTTTPTLTPRPQGLLQPRAVALFLGRDVPGIPAPPFGQVFIDPVGPPPPVAVIDSFLNPLDPVFGPSLQGRGNTITLTLAADLFDPVYHLPLPTLTFQAVAQDTPGNPLQISNPVRIDVVDPQPALLGPLVSGIAPLTMTGTGMMRPVGPASGGNTVTILGDRFLAQSDWTRFPPRVVFGSARASLVTVVDATTLTVVVPAAPPPPPGQPPTCLVPVTVTNNLMLSPAAVTVTSPVPYLYLTGSTPVVTGISPSHATIEGGEALVITGQGLHPGLQVTFTSQTNPAVAVTLSPPPQAVSAGGTSVSLDAPPFCAGGVDVIVTNCDEVVSVPFPFTYQEQPPILATVAPQLTVRPELRGGTYPVFAEAGTATTITGTGFLPPDSPLFSAPGVPASLLFVTRVFLGGALESGLAPPAGSRTTITGTTQAFNAGGMLRSRLGFQELRLENPPCARIGNGSPISNPPCPPSAPPCTVLVQDDQGPQIAAIEPSVGSRRGGTWVTIHGQNFFSVRPGVTSQTFGSGAAIVTSISATDLAIPAVRFGNRFATEVELVNSQTLRARVPVAAAPSGAVDIRVYNPDTQSTNFAGGFRYLVPLTDPVFLESPRTVLDAAELLAIATGTAGLPSPLFGGTLAPAIIFVRNPSPQRDRARDPFNLPGVSYDYCFLFNTRNDALSATTGHTRLFTFAHIDLPATLTLSQGAIAVVPPFDPTLPAVFDPGSFETVPAGRTIRVIVKAAAYTIVGNRVEFNPTFNPPLVLMSQGDLRVNALVHLGGDAFVIERYINANGATLGGPFRVRVDRVLPPAGGGLGGRGGAFFMELLPQLPAPNFGLAASTLGGVQGFPPGPRLGHVDLSTTGLGALGTGPVGVRAGAGGGGGYATPGGQGASGTSAGGFGGGTFGNTTNGASTLLMMGLPADDRNIYGAVPIDFEQFRGAEDDVNPFINQFFYGGSGGGGGGGSLALFVPALALGGRGGNGGGAIVLVSDRILSLGERGVLLAYGEPGSIGVEVFPGYNASPTVPVNAPGTGGSGSGGTIVGFSLAGVTFSYGPNGPLGPPPQGLPFVDARGAGASPAGGPGPAGVTQGGFGGDGRVRIAVSQASGLGPALAAELQSLFGSAVLPRPPSPPALPADHFAFPSN